MEKITGQLDAQEKIIKIVQIRHGQLSEIKTDFDYNNHQLYKGVSPFGQNLHKFEKIFKKKEYQLKCENILSISLSIGKIIDLNNSIKTILISIKIFEEHQKYINNKNNNDNNKTFIINLFKNNSFIPLSQNTFIRERFKTNINVNNLGNNESNSYKIKHKFYESLFGNDKNFFNDFNNYYNLNLKKEEIKSDSENNSNSENKNQEKNKNNQLNKIIEDSFSNKFYSRIPLHFEMDYPDIVYSSCDIFHLLYNKMMDNNCFNPNFFSYIEELDNYIIKYFINPCFNDLAILSSKNCNKHD